jgi:hypothetical protein
LVGLFGKRDDGGECPSPRGERDARFDAFVANRARGNRINGGAWGIWRVWSCAQVQGWLGGVVNGSKRERGGGADCEVLQSVAWRTPFLPNCPAFQMEFGIGQDYYVFDWRMFGKSRFCISRHCLPSAIHVAPSGLDLSHFFRRLAPPATSSRPVGAGHNAASRPLRARRSGDRKQLPLELRWE